LVAEAPPLSVSRENDLAEKRYNYDLGNLKFNAPLGALPRHFRQSSPLHPAARKFCEFLANMSVYDLSVPALRSESPLIPNPVLSRNGDNLASVLDWMRDNHPDSFEIIQEEVRAAAREVKTVSARTTRPGAKVLSVQQRDGHIYDAPVLSDGLVLFVGLAVAAISSRLTPTLIAVEEPERGVHPRRLHEVLDAFRRVSNGGTQIVLTTHSPIVLDAFRDEPERVLVFDRDDSGTRVSRFSDNPESKDLNGLSLGEVWYSGVLGGNPLP
jgi:predicted ATPase